MDGATGSIRAAELTLALSLATDLGTDVAYAERPDELENEVRVFAAELDRRTASASA